MECKAVIIVNYPLFLRFSSRITSCKHFANFVIVVELWEELKALDVVGVIAKTRSKVTSQFCNPLI